MRSLASGAVPSMVMMPPVPHSSLATSALRRRRRWAGDGSFCLDCLLLRILSMLVLWLCLLPLLLHVMMRASLEEGNEIGL